MQHAPSKRFRLLQLLHFYRDNSSRDSAIVQRESSSLTTYWSESTFIIVMIRWTDLAPWVFESSFSGSITSNFLVAEVHLLVNRLLWLQRPPALTGPYAQAYCSLLGGGVFS